MNVTPRIIPREQLVNTRINDLEIRYRKYMDVLNNYYTQNINNIDTYDFCSKLNELILYLRKLNILLYK